MRSSKVPKGRGKGKGKAKARTPNIGPAEHNGNMIAAEAKAKAAIQSGDVASVCKFLQQLFPDGARRAGAELRCMRRAVSLLDTRWKAEVDRKRKATFASEDKGMVDAVLMGGVYLPSDTFALMAEYLDHGTAVRSTPCSRSWWRTISGLPAASHVDTSLGKGMGWAELVTQLKNVRASNPRRSVSRLSLGGKTKLGSFAKLAQAAGGPLALTHLDLTGCKGVRKLDFHALAKALPNLKGLAVEDDFYSFDHVHGWLRQLAGLVRTVKLESLRLKAHAYSTTPNPNPVARPKWFVKDESMISDGTLENLAHGPRFLGASLFPGLCSLRKLWLSAPLAGPSITAGMAAVGAGMPRLEELVVDGLKITDEGWQRFATARADAAAVAAAAAAATASSDNSGTGGGTGSGGGDHSRLCRIRIRANASATVPSATTRGLLEDTVSESVTLYLDRQCVGTAAAGTAAGGGGGSGNLNGDTRGDEQYLDCEGGLIELDGDGNNSTGKIRVVRSSMWGARKGGAGWM